MQSVHIDHFRSPPTAERECMEAIWSEGAECLECWVDCYRRGWPKEQVDADNARLVRAKGGLCSDEEFEACGADATVRVNRRGQLSTKPKVCHMADKVSQNGDVSAICFARPRKINLDHATWTLRIEAVTCPKCRAKLDANA